MYIEKKDGQTILRESDKAFIPADPANRDYQAFLKWKAEGGVSKKEIDNPVIVENEKISRLQVDLAPDIIEAVLALLNNDAVKITDLKAKIEAKITSSGVDSVHPKDVVELPPQVDDDPIKDEPGKLPKG